MSSVSTMVLMNYYLITCSTYETYTNSSHTMSQTSQIEQDYDNNHDKLVADVVNGPDEGQDNNLIRVAPSTIVQHQHNFNQEVKTILSKDRGKQLAAR